jgi:hypothetical protein
MVLGALWLHAGFAETQRGNWERSLVARRDRRGELDALDLVGLGWIGVNGNRYKSALSVGKIRR